MARDMHRSSSRGQWRQVSHPESRHPLPWFFKKARMWPALITAKLNSARCASHLSEHHLFLSMLLLTQNSLCSSGAVL